MSKINRSKLKSALKTFFAKRQGMSLESQVAMLTLLVGAAWAEGAQASEAGASPAVRLSASEQKAIAEIKALMQDGLTSEEIAQIIEATEQLEISQVTEVLEALLSDETLASENLDEMIEQLRAQLEQSRGQAIVLSPSAGKTAVAEAHKALESEFGADAPAAATSKVTVETPKEEDDDDKGIILLNSGDPTQTLGLAPALFAAGPLGPVLGGVVAAAALAGGGGGGGGGAPAPTPPVIITQNGEAIDGYVVGADVFVKAADGTLTKVGTTDANGQFLGLDGTLGLKLSPAQAALHLVVSGGTDASTGLPFQGEMEAPAGSLVVTPLTTIIANMMNQDPTLTADQANDALVAKLGLAPGTDLLTLDPIQVANDPNSTPEEAAMALEAYQRALSIIALANNAAAVGGISFADAFDSVVNSISTNLVTEIGDVGVDGVTAYASATDFVTVATGGLADLNAVAFTGDNLTAFIDAGKDVVGQIDVTVSIDDADSDRNEADAGILGTAESELIQGSDINDLLVGFAGDDTLLGGEGDDTLLGGLGNDSLIGGAGVDTIFGSDGDDTVAINLFTDGNDSIELGSGIDVVQVEGGGLFTLAFNADEVGNDDVHNSETGDLAVKLSVFGNDELSTKLDDEGLRFVAVDAGGTFTVNDGLITGTFNEVVLGSAGADTVDESAVAGDVYMHGGAGNDVLTTGAGNDVLYGGSGDDSLTGGAGNDTLQGGAGNDSIVGGAGDDLAKLNVSTDGGDTIDLGDGSDVITIGGAEQVRITLDLAEVGNGSGTDTNDEYPVSIQAQDENGDLIGDQSRSDDESIRLVAEEGTKFDVRDSVTNESYGDIFDEVILGSEGDEQFFNFSAQGPEPSNRFIALGGGNDVVYTTASGDYISGGAGNDVLFVFGRNNTLSGGEGSDFIYSIGQIDESNPLRNSSLIGGDGNDVLIATDGNNTLDGGAGNDLMLTVGQGDDVAIVNLADEGEDLISLGGGHNTVEVKGDGEFRLNLNADTVGDDPNAGNGSVDDGASLSVFLGLEDKGGAATFTENVFVGYGGGTDVPISDTRASDEGMRFVAVDDGHFDVRVRNGSNPNEGTELGNTFKVVSLGTTGDDILDESATVGDVYINGGAGSDSLVGGDGNDVLIGGRNADYIIPLGENAFTIASDNDTFVGGKGDDLIFGNKGADLAIVDLMTDGNDSINLGADDTIGNQGLSSDGEDTVRISGGSNVTVTLNNAEVGNGDGYKSEDELAVSLQADGSDFVVTTDDEAIRIESAGDETFTVKDDTVVLGSGFDAIVLGGAGNDFIDESSIFSSEEESVENTENTFINGGQGNDVIYSGSGSDLIFGGSGQDFIVAGAGNDVIYGGDGSDNMTGGAGNDTIFGGADSDILSVNLSTDGSDSVDLGSGFDEVRISGSVNTRITLDLAAVGNDDIHSSGDTLAVSVQSEDLQGALTGDILQLDDEGLRLKAEDNISSNGTVLEDAKFHVHDLNGVEVEPEHTFDEVVLGTSGDDYVGDFINESFQNYFGQLFDKSFVPPTAPDVFVEGGMGNDVLLLGSGDDYISGGAGSDTLFGSAGDDTFVGGAGDDRIGTGTFFGGINQEIFNFDESGNDVLRVNLETDGNDTANLGSGLDTVELRSTASHIHLTLDENVVGDGTTNNVLVQAEDENGALTGNILTTDNNGIRFVAEEGSVLELHAHSTSLGDHFSVVSLGTSGGDTLDESDAQGNAYILGGAGSDSLVGGDGNDVLIGGRNADYIIQLSENSFTTAPDNDTFVGGKGDDLIFGNKGSDLAIVDLMTDGNDSINLGTDDTISYFGFSGGDEDTVRISGGSNVTVTLNNAEVGNGDGYKSEDELAVSLQADGSEFVVTTDDEAIRIESAGDETFTIKDDTVVLGSGFDAIVLGSADNDFINEEEGFGENTENTFINGGQGNDVIYSGSGSDLIFGGSGQDFISAGAGNDVIYGGDGSDNMIGGAGNDTIFGGADSDTLSVNLSTDGSDSVDLGSGFDYVRISGSADTRITLDLADVGNDDIHSSGDTLAASLQSEDLQGALTGDILHLDDEGLRLVAQDQISSNGTVLEDAKFHVHDLNGAEIDPDHTFDEVVLGTSGDDFVSDFISESLNNFFGPQFNENFVPTPAPDVFVEGGMGDDVLLLGSGDDYISGGEGRDVMFGSAGDDTFVGGAGDDRIGNGVFNANSSNIYNADESGNDVFRINLETDGNDTVYLGSGLDTVELRSTASHVRLTLDEDLVGSGTNDNVFVRAEDENGDLTGNILTTDNDGIRFVAEEGSVFELNAHSTALGDHFSVVSLGTFGNDTLDESGTQGDAYILGGAGSDSLVGGDGNDVLVGGRDSEYRVQLTENSFIIAPDDDTFVGGKGDDTIFGNRGADLAIVNLMTDGNDAINLGTDDTILKVGFFNAPEDTVQISGGSNVTVTLNNDEVGNGDAYIGDNVLAVSLQADGSNFVVTTDDEAIRIESAGNETFTIKDDTVVLGSGFDVVELGSANGDYINESGTFTFEEGFVTNTENMFVNAGQGNDVIFTGSGTDLIFGGSGQDFIKAGAGNDTVFGGSGGDTLSVNLSTDGSDSVDMGFGYDTVRVSGSLNTRITLDVATVGNNDIHSSGNTLAVSVQAQDEEDVLNGDILHIDDEGLRFIAEDTLNVNGTIIEDAKFHVHDLNGLEVDPGHTFDEVVLGSSDGDRVDDFISKSIVDFIGFNASEEYVPPASPDVFVEGGMGNDTLLMASGNDYISGGEGNDVMFGSAGDDTFIAGAGDDVIGSGSFSPSGYNPQIGFNLDESGNDVLIVNLETDGNDRANLGSGYDTVELTTTAEIVRMTFTGDSVGTGSANDVFVQAEDGSGNVVGNTLTTDDEGIRFDAPDGTQFSLHVNGTSLGDHFGLVQLGTTDADVFDESGRTDGAYLNGGFGDDSITGGLDRDYLVGGADNDTIVGGAGNDSMFGGEGEDLIRVNLDTDDSDFADLGSGIDLVDVSSTEGQIRVSFESAGVGQGDLNLVTAQAEDGMGNPTGSILTTDDEGIRFVAHEGQLFDLHVNGSVLGDFGTIDLGSSGNDTFNESLSTSRVYIQGGLGDDVITGGSADDILLGGEGSDVLMGGAGNDLIQGGAGNDDIARFDDVGRVLSADDVFSFDGETNTLTFSDSQSGGSVEVDTMTGIEFLNFGEFNGNNPVFVTEAQLAILDDANVAFAANNDVTLLVDGSTLSENHLTLDDLARLGIDHVSVSGAALNIKLGSDEFDTRVELAHVTEAQLAYFDAAHVGFAGGLDVTLAAAGTTLSDNHLTLDDLQDLGIDHVQTDGPLVNIEAGDAFTGANELSAGTDLRAGIDFTYVNPETLEIETSIVKLGLSEAEVTRLISADSSGGYLVDDLMTVAGKDQIALIEGGQVTLSEEQADHLFGLGGDPKLSFADSFSFAESDGKGFDPLTDVTHTTVTLNVEGSTVSDHNLSLFDLARLGVDEVHLPSGEADTGLNLNLGLGETFEHFASSYLASHEGDFAGAFNSASIRTQEILNAGSNLMGWSVTGSDPTDSLGFTGGDNINHVTLFDATSEDVAAVYKSLAQAGDSNYLDFGTFEGNLFNALETQFSEQLGATTDIVSVLVADAGTQGTVLADSELTAADLDNLGFDQLLLGQRDAEGNIEGVADLGSLLEQLNGFNLDSLTDDASNIGDLDQDSIALVNIDPSTLTATTFALEDLMALSDLGLDKIAIGNSFDDFVANGTLDIDDLIDGYNGTGVNNPT